jgi:hypothetical protein
MARAASFLNADYAANSNDSVCYCINKLLCKYIDLQMQRQCCDSDKTKNAAVCVLDMVERSSSTNLYIHV